MSGIKKRPISVILLMLALPIFALSNTGVVKKVLSGDLVQIGDTFVARLTGIKAPLRDEIIGYKIYDFTKRELEGKKVKIFTWTTDNTATRSKIPAGKLKALSRPRKGSPKERAGNLGKRAFQLVTELRSFKSSIMRRPISVLSR